MSTFHARLKAAVGPRGFESSSMRRSIQTVILYEACRCLRSKFPSLRPFQRKIAFFNQVMALMEGIDYIAPYQKTEILWRTGTSKEPLQPETAWKRMKVIDKDIEMIIERVKPFCVEGRSHQEACEAFIQHQYDQNTNTKGKMYPIHWEHTHHNVFMTYRMYYDKLELDPTFPAPEVPLHISVPDSRPTDSSLISAVNFTSVAGGSDAGTPDGEEPAARRRHILDEVRTHMDLLKDFVGVVPHETLLKRKKELFAALPSAPPATDVRMRVSKRARLSSTPASPGET